MTPGFDAPPMCSPAYRSANALGPILGQSRFRRCLHRRQHAMRNSLTQAFTTFLGRRHALRHFARHPHLAALVKLDTAAAARTPVPDDLLLSAQGDPSAAIARLQSDAAGLTQEEAARRLVRYGPNEIAHEKPLPAWLRLWRCYLNPFNLLLTVLACLSWFSADAKATIVISTDIIVWRLFPWV